MPVPILMIGAGIGVVALGGALMTEAGRRGVTAVGRAGALGAARLGAEALEEIEDFVAEVRADVDERGLGALRPRRGPLGRRPDRRDG